MESVSRCTSIRSYPCREHGSDQRDADGGWYEQFYYAGDRFERGDCDTGVSDHDLSGLDDYDQCALRRHREPCLQPDAGIERGQVAAYLVNYGRGASNRIGPCRRHRGDQDRKSTRLNSNLLYI